MRLGYRGLVLLFLILGADLPANAGFITGPVTDPANDFRTFDPANSLSYARPANPGLDVLSANVIIDTTQNTITFTSTMAGPISGLINPSTGALLGSFSWGINHGFSISNFTEIGLPNVLFDAVLTLNPNGTATYRGEQAPASSVSASGNTLTAVLPLSFVAPPPAPPNAPGQLLPDTEWTFNLWPRSSVKTDGTTLGFGDAQIADFAPNTVDFAAQVGPEPSSMVILGTGMFGAGFFPLLGWLRQRREDEA